MNKGMERQTILAKCIYCGHEVRFDVEIEINNHYRKEIEYYKKQLERMNKALTPPTSDEVCVALSAWAGKKIKYLPLTDENYECFTDGKHHYFVNDIDCNEVIEWLPCPVYIMSLIGRFYENKKGAKK